GVVGPVRVDVDRQELELSVERGAVGDVAGEERDGLGVEVDVSEAHALALEEESRIGVDDRDPVEDRIFLAAGGVPAAEDAVADVVADGAVDARDLERAELPVVALLLAAREADEREAAGQVAVHAAQNSGYSRGMLGAVTGLADEARSVADSFAPALAAS